MSKNLKIISCLFILSVVGFGFQNCSKVKFNEDSNNATGSSADTLEGDSSSPENSSGVLENITVQDSTSGSIALSACHNSSCNDSLINPKLINIKSRLVEIKGSCSSILETVDFGNDILNLTSTKATCTDGKFKHCVLVKKNYEENKVEISQKTDKVQFNALLNADPEVRLSMDKFIMNGVYGIVSGKCVPSSVLNITIYNKKQNAEPVVCNEDGTYIFKTVKIIKSVKIKKLFVEQISSSAPTRTIYFDVEQTGLVPKCGIKNFSALDNICSGLAGEVQGTCLPGLPVDILVKGQIQTRATCSSQGTFNVKDVLLSDKSLDKSDLSVNQTTPFGQKCN